MAQVTSSPSVRTYGNWRRPASAGLMGLGSLGTWVMLGGLILMVLVIMAAGLLAGRSSSPSSSSCWRRSRSKTSTTRTCSNALTTRLAYTLATRRGATLYRSGPLGRMPWGTCQLPGLAASLKVSEHQDAYGRPFAMIEAPATRTYCVVFAAEPDGASLVDHDQIDVWVADWGQWLANLGDEPGVEAAAVTIETAPDTGHRLAQQIQHTIDPDAPVFARRVLEDIVDTYPAGIQHPASVGVGHLHRHRHERSTPRRPRDGTRSRRPSPRADRNPGRDRGRRGAAGRSSRTVRSSPHRLRPDHRTNHRRRPHQRRRSGNWRGPTSAPQRTKHPGTLPPRLGLVRLLANVQPPREVPSAPKSSHGSWHPTATSTVNE